MADYRIHTTEQANRIADLVRALSVEGKQWVVTIKKYQKQRSLPANNLYWKWLTIIGNEIGYSKDEMHDITCPHEQRDAKKRGEILGS